MNHITLFQNPADCSGCGACAAACPKQAITMQPDQQGCLYPVISQESCIQCGKCLQVCGYKAGEGTVSLCAYGAVGKTEDIVSNSASGGVFATLAASCMEQGGMAAGAVMDLEQNSVAVYHILSGDMEDISRMQGSKYVQSQAFCCYKDVQKTLRTGKKVFFSGTPCQVSAIKKLTGDPENLITADLICHGIPPAEMLGGFIKVLGKRFRGEVKGLCFRDKTSPKSFTARIQIQKGRKTKIYRLRPQYLSFYQHFLEASTYRETCYQCPYACMKRVSDLTLGDYWGVEKYHAEDMKSGTIPDRRDWSCVLVNTEKGRAFLETCGKDLLLFPTKAEWVAQTNRQLREPSTKGQQRDQILQAYTQGGYAAVERQFIRDKGGALRFYRRMYRSMRHQ